MLKDVELSSYQLLARVARGGMGVVWKARRRDDHVIVAVKFRDEQGLSPEIARERFRREIECARRLKHPHVATCMGAGYAGDREFYVMEFIDGVPFDEQMRGRRVALETILTVFVRCCRALAYVHDQGILHRDISCSNVLVCSDESPRIVDFGLAKVFHDGNADQCIEEGDGYVVGSPGYMPPEQALGANSEVTVQSDVYAMGAVLYKTLLGTYPHDQSGHIQEVLRRKAIEPIRKPRDLHPGFPDQLERIIVAALSPDKRTRYPSVDALADDVEAYCNGVKVSKLAQPGAAERIARLFKSR